jgi:uncharacterized membrane protein
MNVNIFYYYNYMKLIDRFQNSLHYGVYIIQIFTYTISFVIISISILISSYIYFRNFRVQDNAYNDTKLYLSRSISIALSFILGVEILKLFYIKSYKQLIIVATLVTIKLLVTYFLSKEIDKSRP